MTAAPGERASERLAGRIASSRFYSLGIKQKPKLLKLRSRLSWIHARVPRSGLHQLALLSDPVILFTLRELPCNNVSRCDMRLERSLCLAYLTSALVECDRRFESSRERSGNREPPINARAFELPSFIIDQRVV